MSWNVLKNVSKKILKTAWNVLKNVLKSSINNDMFNY